MKKINESVTPFNGGYFHNQLWVCSDRPSCPWLRRRPKASQHLPQNSLLQAKACT